MAKKGNEPPKFPEIGERLTQFIEQSSEPNARQFALRAGLAPQLVSNLAAGYSMPSGETLIALGAAYKGFDAMWLLTGKNTASAQLPPQVPSKLEPSKPTLPTPGEATPVQADFVGRLIKRLEDEIAGYQEREAWYQEMLKKPLASADAANLYDTVDLLAARRPPVVPVGFRQGVVRQLWVA